MGLELRALDTPNLESPPTNSLPPLRCPLRDGVTGALSSVPGVSGGVAVKPDVSAELKLKLGSVDVALLCVFAKLGCGGRLTCMETGRLFCCSCSRRDASGFDGCRGNENSGFGTISIRGAADIGMLKPPAASGFCTSAMSACEVQTVIRTRLSVNICHL